MARSGFTRTYVGVTGLDKVMSALEGLAASTSRAVVERAVKTALEPMRAEAERLAPVDAAKGHLKRSLIISKNRAGYVPKLQRDRASSVVMFMGPRTRTGAYPEAILQEFGSKPHTIRAKSGSKRIRAKAGRTGQALKPYMMFRLPDGSWRKVSEIHHPGNPPRPYMRPAWDKHYRTCMDNLRDAIGDEVMRAAKNAARRNRAS